jgi:4-alpha-glucanotransferase
VELRAQFGLVGAEAATEQSAVRGTERRQFLDDLRRAGLLSDDAASAPDPAKPALVVAAHGHLARTPSRLFAARLEDMVGEREPVNLPSTVDEYPNWRRKLSLPLEDLPGTELFNAICGALRAERPRRKP